MHDDETNMNKERLNEIWIFHLRKRHFPNREYVNFCVYEKEKNQKKFEKKNNRIWTNTEHRKCVDFFSCIFYPKGVKINWWGWMILLLTYDLHWWTRPYDLYKLLFLFGVAILLILFAFVVLVTHGTHTQIYICRYIYSKYNEDVSQNQTQYWIKQKSTIFFLCDGNRKKRRKKKTNKCLMNWGVSFEYAKFLRLQIKCYCYYK